MVFCGEVVVIAWSSVVIWMVVFARQENFTFSKIFLWKFMTVRRESQDVHAPGMPPVVACPNQDVVYGFSLLDMAQEPIVIQVPDFGDRFWVYQIVDQRTDSFVEMGKMYGTKPGFYLLTGPEWKGTAPSGINRVFQSKTNLGIVIPRAFMDDTAEDRKAIQPVLMGILLYPLSKFTGKTQTIDWATLPNYPSSSQGKKRPSGSYRRLFSTSFPSC